MPSSNGCRMILHSVKFGPCLTTGNTCRNVKAPLPNSVSIFERWLALETNSNAHMDPVLFEMRESVAVITLNRPEKYNAFNREMALLLQEKLDDCKKKNVRCVYITGAGKAFSSG